MTKVTMEIPAARASQMARFFADEGFVVFLGRSTRKTS
jgi:hypothetical protein